MISRQDISALYDASVQYISIASHDSSDMIYQYGMTRQQYDMTFCLKLV